jgi:hypothetical protein
MLINCIYFVEGLVYRVKELASISELKSCAGSSPHSVRPRVQDWFRARRLAKRDSLVFQFGGVVWE